MYKWENYLSHIGEKQIVVEAVRIIIIIGWTGQVLKRNTVW